MFIIKNGGNSPALNGHAHLKILYNSYKRKQFTKYCLEGLKGGREEVDDEMFSKPSLPETSFSGQNASTIFGVGFCPNPLRERKRSLDALTAVGGQGREQSIGLSSQPFIHVHI